MPQGTIKKLIADKGFGFIEGERGDLFFHHSAWKEQHGGAQRGAGGDLQRRPRSQGTSRRKRQARLNRPKDRFMSSIHVGNLSVSTTEEELRQAFSQHGAVAEVKHRHRP